VRWGREAVILLTTMPLLDILALAGVIFSFCVPSFDGFVAVDWMYMAGSCFSREIRPFFVGTPIEP
jgi:hypothetical protein